MNTISEKLEQAASQLNNTAEARKIVALSAEKDADYIIVIRNDSGIKFERYTVDNRLVAISHVSDAGELGSAIRYILGEDTTLIESTDICGDVFSAKVNTGWLCMLGQEGSINFVPDEDSVLDDYDAEMALFTALKDVKNSGLSFISSANEYEDRIPELRELQDECRGTSAVITIDDYEALNSETPYSVYLGDTLWSNECSYVEALTLIKTYKRGMEDAAPNASAMRGC